MAICAFLWLESARFGRKSKHDLTLYSAACTICKQWFSSRVHSHPGFLFCGIFGSGGGSIVAACGTRLVAVLVGSRLLNLGNIFVVNVKFIYHL